MVGHHQRCPMLGNKPSSWCMGLPTEMEACAVISQRVCTARSLWCIHTPDEQVRTLDTGVEGPCVCAKAGSSPRPGIEPGSSA